MKKIIAAIFSIAAIALSQSAIAQAAPFNSPHKWTNSATGKNYVFIPNQTPLSSIPGLISLDESGEESVITNDCGWGGISVGSNIISLVAYTGAAINWSGRSRGATPTCTQDSSGNWITNNNAPIGTVVLTTGRAWIRGGTGWGSFVVTKGFGKSVTSKSNACGFLRVAVTPTRSMNSFNVGGTSYSLAGIPAVVAPMICRKTGASSAIYTPLNP